MARFGLFLEVSAEDIVSQCGYQADLANREEYFDAPIKVARHEVGAAEIDFLLAAIEEVKNAAVFKETADNTGYVDVVADARNAWPQAADSANQKIDFHSRLGSLIEQLDHLAVYQRVHLEDQTSRSACFLMIDLALQQFLETIAQRVWRDQQLAIFRLGGIAGKKVEKVTAIGPDIGIAGQHGDIGVELRGYAVVISGRKMRVSADDIAFFANDECGLAVHLEAEKAIHHVYAVLF